jgi:hypothetical protein
MVDLAGDDRVAVDLAGDGRAAIDLAWDSRVAVNLVDCILFQAGGSRMQMEGAGG